MLRLDRESAWSWVVRPSYSTTLLPQEYLDSVHTATHTDDCQDLGLSGLREHRLGFNDGPQIGIDIARMLRQLHRILQHFEVGLAFFPCLTRQVQVLEGTLFFSFVALE